MTIFVRKVFESEDNMFWRDRARDNKNQNGGGGPPCGQVRVLVVGDSGISFFF